MYRRLDEAVAELRERMGGLPNPVEAEGIWTTIWFQEAHHSTAIEGNTLVLKQVERLLTDGVAVGDKELSEYMEVRGYADAARWVYGQALEPGAWSNDRLLMLAEVRQVHEMALAPVWGVAPHPNATDRERPGSFREHDIQPFPGSGGRRRASRAVRRVGRTGRLLLNLVLVRLGYAPAIVYKRDRTKYLQALRKADADDPEQLGEMIARAVLDNLYRFFVPAVAGPNRLVPLAALASPDLSEGALRLAANCGRLRAHKGSDGHWRSTKAWLDSYIASRHQRRDPTS